MAGRVVEVSDADWVRERREEGNLGQARMEDGQHLNDSLIDLFVTTLVPCLVVGR